MPSLHAVAIVDAGRPVALINRRAFMDQYGLPYHREVFGKRPCNRMPLIVERGSTFEQIARLFTTDDPHYLSDGFIVTDDGCYAGLATRASMVRTVTEARVEATRYANPLTFLPGNVPLNSHINRLVENGAGFIACYFDLDHFKAVQRSLRLLARRRSAEDRRQHARVGMRADARFSRAYRRRRFSAAVPERRLARA